MLVAYAVNSPEKIDEVAPMPKELPAVAGPKQAFVGENWW